jgi:cell division protein FtsX
MEQMHLQLWNLKKEQLRICFGGKTISKEYAYKKAIEYIKTLPGVKDATIIDKRKTVYNLCPQQAAAPGGEVTPQEENSVITSGGSASSAESAI